MAIRQRGTRFQSRIFEDGKQVNQKSFGTRSEAEAWEKLEYAKLEVAKNGDYYRKANDVASSLGTTALPPILGKLLYEELQRRKASKTRDEPDDDDSPAGMSLRALVQKFEDEKGVALKGWRTDRHRYAMLRKLKFASKPMDEVTRDDVSKWRAARQAAKKNNCTINKEVALLSRIYNVAWHEWQLRMPTNDHGQPYNPAKLPRLTQNAPRDRRLATAEEECLLRHSAMVLPGNALRSEPAAIRLTLALRLMLEINFRRGEFVKMKRSDITWPVGEVTTGSIHLPAKIVKNGLKRDVPLSTKAIAIMREVIEKIPSPDGRVFPFVGESLSNHFRDVRARAAKEMPSLATFRLHDTRHESLSRISKLVDNPFTLKAISGHKDLKSLGLYINHHVADLAALLDK